MADDKLLFQEEFRCPHCGNMTEIRRLKKTISEPQKGEYEEYTEIKKMEQTKVADYTKDEETDEENNR